MIEREPDRIISNIAIPDPLDFGLENIITRPFVIISYFTVDSGYEKEILKLRDSCDAFKLPYWFEGIRTFGTWMANVHYRPIFKRRMAHMFPEKSLVWVDADGIIRQDPVLFDWLETQDFDIAAHYFRGRELLGGTFWFRPSARSIELMDQWETVNGKYPTIKEQYNLQCLLQSSRKDIKMFRLPAGYCLIFDLMRGQDAPVIEHFQASRRLKREMGMLPHESRPMRTGFHKGRME